MEAIATMVTPGLTVADVGCDHAFIDIALVSGGIAPAALAMDINEPQHIVKNAAAVRDVLETSGKVKAVFTGHQHSGLIDIVKGITYYSLRGLVLNAGAEENSYALAEVFPSGTIAVTGYRKAVTTTIGRG